jgi:hypothetical protein
MSDCEYVALTLKWVGALGAAVIMFRVGEWWGWRSARKYAQKIINGDYQS